MTQQPMDVDPKTAELERLELRAMAQRNRLHNSAEELKEKIASTRDKLDVTRNAREHFTAAAVIVGAISLLSGYAIAGRFVEG